MKTKAVAIARKSFLFVRDDGFGFQVEEGKAYDGVISENGAFDFVQFADDGDGVKKRFDISVPPDTDFFSVHIYANGKTLNG